MTYELKLEVPDEYFGPYVESFFFPTKTEVDEFLNNIEIDTGQLACIESLEVLAK